METSVKTKPKSQVMITIVVSDDELKLHEAAALKKLASETKIPGFRAGKIPEARLRQHYGQESIQARIIDYALPKLYLEAVKAKDVKPVGRPAADITTLSPLTISFTVDVFPEVKVKKVDSITLKRQEVQVTDGEVQEVLADLQKRGRTFVPVDRPAKLTDSVEVSFQGEVDGRSDARLKSQHHPIILGSKSFIPGFEEQLVGVSTGEQRDVRVTFPSDYRAVDFRGKEVTFHVTVDAVEEVVLPPLDDALAKSVTGKEEMTLDALTAEVRTDLLKVKEEQERDRLDKEYTDALVERTEADLPETLVHDEVHYMLDELAERVQGQGLKFEHYLELQRTSREQLEQKLRPDAEKRVKIRLALRSIADERKIVVAPTEVEAALEAVEDVQLRGSPRFRSQLEAQLLLSKTLTTLRDAAIRT